MFKLRSSPLTNDETSKHIKEIQDTLAGHERTLARHEEQFTRQAETLTRHDDALSRIDAEGNQIHKEMKGLKDKVFQNAVAQNCKPINFTKIGSENLTQNINNFYFTDQRLFENLINTPKQTAINQPPGALYLQGAEEIGATLSSQPFVERSMSCPMDLDNFHGPRMEARHPIQFPTSPGETSISSELDQMLKRWSKSNDQPNNQTHRRASYPDFAVSISLPSSAPNYLGFGTQSPCTNWQSNPTNLLNSRPIFTISDQVQESKRSLQFRTSPSDASISSLPKQIPTYPQLTGKNQTCNRDQSRIDVGSPKCVPGKHWSKGNDQPKNRQANRRESYPECTVSTCAPSSAPSSAPNYISFTTQSPCGILLSSPTNGFSNKPIYTSSDQIQASKWSFPPGAASNSSNMSGRTRDSTSQLMEVFPQVSDLTQFLKETVLPSDFDADIEVSIDGKEYEACCKRLKPRDLREMGKTSYSQSFSHTEELSDEETDPRSKSMEELSSSKRAFDELFLIICRNGGRMEYVTAVKQLSPSSETEIKKAVQQGKMDDRFRILLNKVIQAIF